MKKSAFEKIGFFAIPSWDDDFRTLLEQQKEWDGKELFIRQPNTETVNWEKASIR